MLPCGVQPLKLNEKNRGDITSFVYFAVNSTDAAVSEGLLFATRRRACFVVVVVVFIGLYRSAG